MNRPSLQRRWLKPVLFLALWGVVGLSFASQFYISSSKAGLGVTWKQALSYSLSDWYVWAAVSLPIIWMVRRFPIEAPLWRRHALIHLAASATASIVYMALRAAVEQIKGALTGAPIHFRDAFDPLLIKTFHFNVLVYWVIVSVNHAFAYYRKFRDREFHAMELEQRLTAARLQALQMQLNPHFLFNTLHAISSLMHKDVEAADRMIVRLGDLLRYALDSTGEQEVRLRQEIDFIKRYLEIEQTRFGERLRIDIRLAANTLDALVPNLILQPLVENAIQHGIEPQARPGTLQVSSQRDGGDLILQVSDNGTGLAGHSQNGEGIGLSNTRSRLEQLYGNRQSFGLSEGATGGVTVTLRLPFRSPDAIAAPA